MTRSWHMFADRCGHGFRDFGDERTVRFKGGEPVAVELTEDPDGIYWGYIQIKSVIPNWEFTGVPMMIQGHEGVFRMQSPDGFRRVESGKAEVVRMSCRAVDA